MAIRSVAVRLRRTTTRDPNQVYREGMTFGEHLADRVATIGGSWAFILCFCAFLVGWVSLNTIMLASRAIDPFPFVFLNLILSMLAALQAPIIMMSQNRQATKDRVEARLDYEVNQRAEAQIARVLGEVSGLCELLRERRSELV